MRANDFRGKESIQILKVFAVLALIMCHYRYNDNLNGFFSSKSGGAHETVNSTLITWCVMNGVSVRPGIREWSEWGYQSFLFSFALYISLS